MEPQSQYLLMIAQNHNIGATLLVHYTLLCARLKEVPALCRMLPLVAASDTDIVYEDVNLHALTSSLAVMAESFSRQEVCEAVFNQFFLVRMYDQVNSRLG